MPLPGSGQISVSDIYTETTQSGKLENYSLTELSRGAWNGGFIPGYSGIDQNSTSKPNRDAQHAMSEFFSYNHNQNGSCSGTSFSDVISSYSDRRRSYHRINATGNVGDIVVITVVCPPSPGAPFPTGEYATYYIFDTYPFNSSGDLLIANVLYSGGTNNTSNSNRTDTWRYTLTATSKIIYIVVMAYDGAV